MNRLTSIAAIAAAAAMVSLPSVAAGEEAENAPTKGEIKLSKMLEGRVAGEPLSCIPFYSNVRQTVIDGTALVFRSGRTLYVNIPHDADRLDNQDILVRRTTFGTRLCSTDIITTVDSSHGGYTGNVFLSKFVPYRKEG